MRIIRILGGVTIIGVGAYLLVPLIVAIGGVAFAATHGEVSMDAEVAGFTLRAWQMWALFSLLAVIGIRIAIVGVYLLRSSKSRA